MRSGLDRIGKKDWWNVVMGVLVKNGTSAAVDQAKVMGLVNVVKQGLIHLYHNLPQLMPGS